MRTKSFSAIQAEWRDLAKLQNPQIRCALFNMVA